VTGGRPPRARQVNSEFHAFKHFEALGPGELQRAVAPLEATLALHPTLLLANALPAAMDIVIWQARRRPRPRRPRPPARPSGGRPAPALLLAGAPPAAADLVIWQARRPSLARDGGQGGRGQGLQGRGRRKQRQQLLMGRV